MDLTLWILLTILQTVYSERGGSTHCTAGAKFPTTLGTGTTAPPAGTGVLIQDSAFMLTCCGVVEKVHYRSSGGGSITAQVWRQTGANAFELISKNDYTLTAGNPGVFTTDDTNKLSFQEGDLIGWYGAGGLVISRGTDSSYKLARVSTSIGATAVGATSDWSAVDVDIDRIYSIQYEVAPSSDPYFKNLPTTLSYADTSTTVGGITLMTLSASDLDPEDVAGVSIVMAPQWNDYFLLDNTSYILTTARKLEPGTYNPVFRVEETHCGRTASATLTVSVTDSSPSITNLPASATIHEDTRDETLLYTVTTSDPTDQPIWCKGDWTPGSSGANLPFIVKMISTASANSRAGIYLIEEPALDYDATAQFYNLSVICTDMAGNTDTESFYVSITKNRLPIFTNLGNMVEIDAKVVKVGTLVFTVSISDADNDQITYTTVSCLPADCPFILYDNGDVILNQNLLLWDTVAYTFSITATDLRDTNTARSLIIYIKNTNNAPVFSNLNGNVQIAENSNLSLSLFQVSATDGDSDSLTYYMTMNTEEGWKLFDMSSTGEVTTHSVNNIDFDPLASPTHDMVVYVHDGKEIASATLTLTVLDVNETLAFTQSFYALSHDEGTSGTLLSSANIASTDPDTGDTKTYSMNCGTYDSYFSINTASAAVSYAQNYDLDTGTLPTEVLCNLTVIDSHGFNDTAQLYITITYTNDFDPVFNPASYSATINSTAPIGFSVLTVTATDSDQDVDGVFTYSLSATGLFAISEFGVVYVKADLSSTSGVQSLTVSAIDQGATPRTGQASISITVNSITNTPTTTTDRNREFREDPRNIYWLVVAVITVLVCLFVIALIIIRYCLGRKEPLCKDWWKKPKKRKLDKRRRPKPFGRQQEPTYRHVHATEILRASPPPIMTPDIVEDNDKYSTRALSASSLVSGRVNLSQVNLNDRGKAKDDDINSWMNEPVSTTRSVAPERAVTQPKARDRDYLGRARRSNVHASVSPVPPSPSVSLPDNNVDSLERLQPGGPLRVNPSPDLWDNTRGEENESYIPEDDEFRSENLHIMTPVTVHAEAY